MSIIYTERGIIKFMIPQNLGGIEVQIWGSVKNVKIMDFLIFSGTF